MLAALAIVTAALCIWISVTTGGWLIIFALIPHVLLCLMHVVVHWHHAKSIDSRPSTLWFISSDAMLLAGFLLWRDTGDSSEWLAITAILGGGRGSAYAVAPAWLPEGLWTNLLVFIPYVAATFLWRSGRSASEAADESK